MWEEQCAACYTQWLPRICRYVARFHPGRTRAEDREEAKDIAQVTFLWACGGPHTRCQAGQLYTYARSRAIDRLRRMSRETSLESLQFGDGRPRDFEDTGNETEEHKVKRLALEECLSKLAPDDREIILLSADGLGQDEIALIVEKSRGAVGRKVSEIRDRLTECVTGHERVKNHYQRRQAAGEAAARGQNEPG